MDLLEYMRVQNNMTQEEWEHTFEEEAREIFVLVAGSSGAAKRNGFWEAAHSYLAYVYYETGALCADDGRLVYPVNDKDNAAGNVLGRFRDEEIYRVAARKKIPQELPEGMSASSQNEFLIVEVLEEDAPCPALKEVLADYRRPVVVTDEVLGELTLDKDYDTFEGVISWRDEDIDISLEVDSSSEDTWTAAVAAMKQMVADQDRWDRDMQAFAARELTELACEWRESADEDVPEITEESFAQRIELTSIAMDPDGSFSAYFDDDDMFFGHCVVVYGTLEDGVSSAVMAG
ncbi:DUF2262 domain-containing protein [Schaalia odontolytica]|uniref:DUF2262 domain-containing protein n=2 Tax=Schaalia odontolytica TaxID=1660 RepID=A0A857AC33_9ACTO|nr:DUF2262 domain-containing protein [Schaalia odontolytica]EFF80870.1 hypothetical protein HMPREF0970_00128 [Schaalia odontolytica F0309]QGS11573.1 DUF2262 domain-containing protein [Schaalia odontolytica]